jgi:transcriptional regulator with XRE-family HTH domain
MLHLRLLEMRKEKGISQIELAKHLKISNQAYSLYELGKRQMNYETLCLLADYFGVSTDYLLGRQDAIPSFLTEEERGIIERYRTLDGRGRQTVQNTIEFEASQNNRVIKKSAM